AVVRRRLVVRFGVVAVFVVAVFVVVVLAVSVAAVRRRRRAVGLIGRAVLGRGTAGEQPHSQDQQSTADRSRSHPARRTIGLFLFLALGLAVRVRFRFGRRHDQPLRF